MGISYDVVLGVGVEQDDITYESLTDYGKSLIREEFKSSDDYLDVVNPYCDEDGTPKQDLTQIIEEALPEWFEDNLHDCDLFYVLDLNCITQVIT